MNSLAQRSSSVENVPSFDAETITGHEAIEYVKRNEQAWFDVSVALRALRDRELYLGLGYKNFGELCQAEFSWTRQRAHQLITAGEIVRHIPQLTTESQTRRVQPLLTQAATPAAGVAAVRAVVAEVVVYVVPGALFGRLGYFWRGGLGF